mmetsp:Transcript_24783/g.63178  ORF Transcript_24783/g.63178 Transcript_24783/m.63178 type:complete len:205 (+) Transcript_24783:420-1034(+)
MRLGDRALHLFQRRRSCSPHWLDLVDLCVLQELVGLGMQRIRCNGQLLLENPVLYLHSSIILSISINKNIAELTMDPHVHRLPSHEHGHGPVVPLHHPSVGLFHRDPLVRYHLPLLIPLPPPPHTTLRDFQLHEYTPLTVLDLLKTDIHLLVPPVVQTPSFLVKRFLLKLEDIRDTETAEPPGRDGHVRNFNSVRGTHLLLLGA